MSSKKKKKNEYPQIKAVWTGAKALFLIMLSVYSAIAYVGSSEHQDKLAQLGVAAPPVIQASTIKDAAPSLWPGRVQRLSGNNVFAGNQLKAGPFAGFLNRTKVKTVIRLNTEARGENILSRNKERELCEAAGAAYVEFNVEGKDNRCNESILRVIDQLMDAGNAFVHCTDGQHRSVMVAARHEVRHTDLPWEEITEKIGWTTKHLTDARYRRYPNNAFEHYQERRSAK